MTMRTQAQAWVRIVCKSTKPLDDRTRNRQEAVVMMVVMTVAAVTMMVMMVVTPDFDRDLRDLYATGRIGSGRIVGDELIERIGNGVEQVGISRRRLCRGRR